MFLDLAELLCNFGRLDPSCMDSGFVVWFPSSLAAVLHRVGRLEESKQELQKFNEESSQRLPEVSVKLEAKLKVLNELREDLLHVYQQLR